jgi:hypothetical protein
LHAEPRPAIETAAAAMARSAPGRPPARRIRKVVDRRSSGIVPAPEQYRHAAKTAPLPAGSKPSTKIHCY